MTTHIEQEARAEAERRYADDTVSTFLADVNLADERRADFAAGALWQATRQPTEAEVEAAARVIFEPPSLPAPDDAYTWDQMVREDPSRADMWRQDARAALTAARQVGTQPTAPASHHG